MMLSRMTAQAGPWWTVLVYWNAWYTDDAIAVHVSALLQSLSTLVELVQGPNVENQRIVRDSRLLETLTWIFDAIRKAYFHCGVYENAQPEPNNYGSWGPLSPCAASSSGPGGNE